jgi:hypothetical protein
VLDLSQNQLSGAIPQEIASLKRLTWISLLENELTGEKKSTLFSFH